MFIFYTLHNTNNLDNILVDLACVFKHGSLEIVHCFLQKLKQVMA